MKTSKQKLAPLSAVEAVIVVSAYAVLAVVSVGCVAAAITWLYLRITQ